MEWLHRQVSHLFCCIPSCRHHGEAGYASTLQQPTSTLSIPLPSHTVPHSPNEPHVHDAQALHQIFSAASSVRGYQTASAPMTCDPVSRPSLDRQFQFGSKPTSPQKQGQGPVQKLGQHIRQKLSESRLSKASSKHPLTQSEMNMDTIRPQDETGKEPGMGVSHSSTGLTELLASRNASQGGYDSDAQTIMTPLLRSNAGTLKRNAQLPCEVASPPDKTANVQDVEKADAYNANFDGKTAPKCPEATRGQSTSFAQMPSKPAFAMALQPRLKESPSDVLKRLSIGIADGTITLPTTPEPREKGSACDDYFEQQSQQQTSDQEVDWGARVEAFKDDVKRLSDRVEVLKRESVMTSSSQSPRGSLISELDPGLIHYLTSFALKDSIERSPTNSADEHEAESMPEPVKGAVAPVLSEAASELPGKDKSQTSSGKDQDSIHLFNMRISQRLASLSQLPMMSPASSVTAGSPPTEVETSNLSPAPSIAKKSRCPRFITTEHNRRPSDPQTRRLFESSLSERRMPNSTWLTITTVPSENSHKQLHRTKDDASSFYPSEDGMRSSAVSPTSSRRNSGNPHSLAVGGRSVSGKLPDRHVNRSLGQLSTAAESAWLGQKSPKQNRSSEDSWISPTDQLIRGRSVSMPQKRGNHDQQSPTPFSKRHQGSFIPAETLSEISLDRITDRRNERMTEVSVQAMTDRRNENISEIDATHLSVPKVAVDSQQAYQDIQVINSSPQRAMPRKPSAELDIPRVETPKSLQETATSVWGRAFRTARAESGFTPHNNFLTTPRFDREGRPRSTRASLNEGSSLRRTSEVFVDPLQHRRSQSVEPHRRPSTAIDLDMHKRLCSAARTPLIGGARPSVVITEPLTQGLRSQTMREATEPRKRSLMELGRHFASSGPSSGCEDKATPVGAPKELFGIWSRFPSHDREERNAAATLQDSIRSRDFQADDPQIVITPAAATPETGSNTPVAFKLLSRSVHRKLSKAKSKSMTLKTKNELSLTPAERARRSRKGIMGRWRRLYRTSSGEMRRYAIAHGHRSSISLGDEVEYPELECLPGEGKFRETSMEKWHGEVDGVAEDTSDHDQNPSPPEMAQLEPLTESSAAGGASAKRIGASNWAAYYSSCVGSLSALKSDTDVVDMRSMSEDDYSSLGRNGFSRQPFVQIEHVDVTGTSERSKTVVNRSTKKGKERAAKAAE